MAASQHKNSGVLHFSRREIQPDLVSAEAAINPTVFTP
jgi:hypothetical protein